MMHSESRDRVPTSLWGPLLCLAVGFCGVAGCGGNDAPQQADNAAKSQSQPATPAPEKTSAGDERAVGGPRKPIFGGEGPGDPFLKASLSRTSPSGNVEAASVRQKLKPLQVLVGRWRGVTRKSVAGAKSVEEPLWRWDFSDPKQPALAFESNSSPFLKRGRLTWRAGDGKYQLTAETKDGIAKTYRGDFTQAVEDVPGDGKHLERTYRLTLTQIEPPPGTREPNFVVEFEQQNNNRYLLIVHRKTGERLQEMDRVGNQREGTSFAAKLDDYGEKTCVVSQGLGTMTVTYKGRTYYVCCSGCRKAFEAEPEKWIASFQAWKKRQGK